MRRGATRFVFLVFRYAIKIPRLDSWRLFLHGLLANMQERRFGRLEWAGFCPTLAADPLGLVLVMRRAAPLTVDDFVAFDAEAFCERIGYTIPAEYKPDSFGWLDGEIVAIDYGGFGDGRRG